MALAGGVTLAVPQKAGYRVQPGISSTDGHCRAFDAESSGTIFGSGAGIVVLKRLEDALADGDQIHAVIRGSAVNNDGANKVSFTAPSVEGQATAVSEALAIAGVAPEEISYVEAHGTGTSLGDPIEIAALGQAFGVTDERTVAIGTVKTNIGHLDSASGVTGVIKTVLALKNKQIPPSLHYASPNPKIEFAGTPFYVNHQLADWQPVDGKRVAGVNSVGFGGTNAFAVLEEAPEQELSGGSRPWQLIQLSARTSTALERMTDNLAEHLAAHPELSLADAAYTLQVGRRKFDHRRVLVARDGADAVEALRTRDAKRLLTGYASKEVSEKPVAFLFSGTGSQYLNMAAGLYQEEPLFKEEFDLVCDVLRPHVGADLREVLFVQEETEEAAERLKRTEFAQPALFALEYALARQLMAWGIEPNAMIGHSLGEYVCACLASVFPLEAAAELVAKRAQLIQGLPSGAMLAVMLPEDEVRAVIDLDALSIAAVNEPGQTIVSGEHGAIERLEIALEEQGIRVKRVRTTHAFHSAMMDPILEAFAEVVRSLKPQAPEKPFLSNVTGTWIKADEATDPQYWVKHLRQTVRFADGVQVLLQDPNVLCLEVGPGNTLASFAKSLRTGDGQAVLQTIRRATEAGDDAEMLLRTLGQLFLAGVDVDSEALYAEETRYRVSLPTYPFERQRLWVEPVQYVGGQQTKTQWVIEDAAPAGADGDAPKYRRHVATAYVAPSGETEELLCRFVQELLGVEQVGVHDDFFDLGGNSLIGTKLITRVNSAYGVDVSVGALFEAATVADLAEVVEELLIQEIMGMSQQ